MLASQVASPQCFGVSNVTMPAFSSSSNGSACEGAHDYPVPVFREHNAPPPTKPASVVLFRSLPVSSPTQHELDLKLTPENWRDSRPRRAQWVQPSRRARTQLCSPGWLTVATVELEGGVEAVVAVAVAGEAYVRHT